MGITAANWWIIPHARRRWNRLITGDAAIDYETFLVEKVFKNAEKLKMLSLGSGISSHEQKIAAMKPSWEIHCFDFSYKLIEAARKKAENEGLVNIHFHIENILNYDFLPQEYDIVFFHQALHHFDHVESIIDDLVLKTLTPNGHLIINEYVGKNRLQYHRQQIKEINRALKQIPKRYKKILGTNLYKNKYYGSGYLRMYISDPSECVDSESIMPHIHKRFKTIVERAYGGNILMSALKDIAHHFVEMDEEKKQILDDLFQLEDAYLKIHASDFIFGVYKAEHM